MISKLLKADLPPLHFGSYYNAPAFIKDSCLFLRQEILKPDMKKRLA